MIAAHLAAKHLKEGGALVLTGAQPALKGTPGESALSNAFFLMKMLCFIQTLLKFVPDGPINYKSALIQVLAWCLPGDKPLP